jgi:flavodoxin
MKSLVVYYSFEGDTELIGNAIAKEIGADVLKLEPEVEVDNKEFMKKYLGEKQVLMKTEPILKPYDIDIDDYDFLIIGTPIWSGTFAPAVRTFLNKEKIEGKKIAIFYCFTVQPGRISQYFMEALEGNEIIAQKGCKDPLKEDTEKHLQLAKEWIRAVVDEQLQTEK